jgi:phospholipid/cholesterol/gamma-HCH transport system permease protein
VDATAEVTPVQCELSFSRPTDDTLLVRLSGSWTIQAGLPPATEVQQQMEAGPQVRCLTFDTQALSGWDSGLLTFLLKVVDQCTQHNIETDQAGLPDGARRLLRLATAVPERQGARRERTRDPLLARIGKGTINLSGGAAEILSFLGQAFLAFLKLVRGTARYRRSDLTLVIQECGAQALPIVSLISFLVGLTLAFVGAVQLRLFGAQIYVADLVGLGMAREMGAMMTGIVMAGRTGAAFAAQLGTMTVNEEIDALTTMGISPMEFLVLPRMLALMLMMPLLALYADFMGIVGGGVVGVGMLGLGSVEYFNETRAALSLTDFAVGLSKAAVFGVLVAISGCLRGIQCGRSASAVGEAATSAVVTGIVFIIVSDSILTVIYDVLGV